MGRVAGLNFFISSRPFQIAGTVAKGKISSGQAQASGPARFFYSATAIFL
jgi:hypothetical protein